MATVRFRGGLFHRWLAAPARLAMANGQIMFGGLVLLLLLAVMLFAPFLAPYDPLATDVVGRLQAPSLAHPFGTDAWGRDVLSRVIFGAQSSVAIGGLTMLATVIVGGAIGLLAGYFPGALDSILMRLMEAVMAIPAILLAIALLAILGNDLDNVIIALAVGYVPRLARIVRGLVMAVREEVYVESARAIGCSRLRIVWRYIVPQIMPALLVQASFIVAYAVIAEAGLSFLGVGTPPPNPSWGSILSDGRAYMSLAPWITIFPGIGIMLVVLGLNQLGDGLRDALDPRLRNLT